MLPFKHTSVLKGFRRGRVLPLPFPLPALHKTAAELAVLVLRGSGTDISFMQADREGALYR